MFFNVALTFLRKLSLYECSLLWHPQNVKTALSVQIDSPVLVILHILCQFYIQHNEVMHMTTRKWLLDFSTLCFTRPLSHPNQGIVGDMRSRFNMLQDLLQGNIPFSPCVFTAKGCQNSEELDC